MGQAQWRNTPTGTPAFNKELMKPSTVTPLSPHGYPGALDNLRGQFLLLTAVLLSMACITLGWFFANQQIGTITEGLYRSGSLLGKNLATNSRYGLVSGNRDELARLAHGVLGVEDVSYVLLFTADGRPLIAIGKDRWEQLLPKPPTVLSPINPALPSLRWDDTPAVGAVRFMKSGVTFSEEQGFTLGDILMLLVGQNVDLFYNVSLPIHTTVSTMDSSLGLLFEQYDESVGGDDTPSQSLLGIVEVGMSSLSVQAELRKLMWQAAGMTCLILLVGLLLLVFFSHRITIPLRRLTDAANRVANGELQIDLPSAPAGEIGNLTRVFWHMLQSIHEREIALQDLNRTLEARIDARTEELRLVNGKLHELNRRKSLFVSAASHEIKTPLTSITCHLDNLLMGVDGPLAKDQARVIERVQVNIGRLQHLLVDLLDLCKIELGEETIEIQAVNLGALVTQTVESLQSLAARKGLFIDVHIPSTLPLVAGDPEKLQQIVTNLLHNALKFSPDHGTVFITGQPAEDGFVQVAIQDSGCGIACEEAERIFEPFYRSKHVPAQTRGTGLGLPIAKHLIELHQGHLWVESKMGQGTCFFFTLPIWVRTYRKSVHHDEPVLISRRSSSFGRSDSSELPK